MKNRYSSTIEQLLSENVDILLIPDMIIIREGVSCGDYIILSGQVDDNILRLNFYSKEACELTQAACCLYSKMFCLKKINEVWEVASNLYDRIVAKPSVVFDMFDLKLDDFQHRQECLLSPLKLLITWIEEYRQENYVYGEVPSTIETMECDACVSSCRINWKQEKIQKIQLRGEKKYDVQYLKNWLPLGKIELTSQDIVLLRKMCSDMTSEDHQFLSDMTMNSFVLHHLLNYAPELIDENWKRAAYLIQKNEINMGHFEVIRNYIERKEIDAYFVKGYISQKYYEYPSLRIHSDYDIIVTNSKDAFKLTNYLMKNGFSIRPNLFSIKEMVHLGETTISGHFHVQKIIDDTYMLELDISFPGFPINRTELFYPGVSNNEIALEDQIIITLLHLFKHSDIYMKDINDLYYMLKDSRLRMSRLNDLLQEYHLMYFFSIALCFIMVNYPDEDNMFGRVADYMNIENKKIQKVLDEGWPYDVNVHRQLKQEDLMKRIKNKPESERLYLYPVVIFKEEYLFDSLDRISKHGFLKQKVFEAMYEISLGNYKFYLTSIGILINNYIDTQEINRIEFIEIIKKFLYIIEHEDYFPIPFATEHFYVRVI